MNEMDATRLQGANEEQWEQLIFSLEERDKPTLIVIGFDSYSMQKIIYKGLEKKFLQYQFIKLDLSAESIESLNRAFIKHLPETVLHSRPVEYIVNVFGLENSLFSVQNDRIEESSLIPELNFEREILFQRYPFVIIIWTDSYTVNQLKKEAKDLWDWISYHFEFKTDDAEQSANLRYNKKPQTRVFISYVPEDYAIAKKLYDDLKTAGFQPWLDREDLLLGQNWKIAISEAIKESDYFLALLSSHSLGKRGYYVQKELKLALDILEEFPSDEIYIIPVRVEPCEPLDERLQDIHWIELYPSYETGFKQILKLIHPAQRKRTIDNRAFFPIDKKNQFEIADRIQRLAERYDTIKLDDALRERTIKEKIDIQKLLGQEYMALKDYGKAEQCFRLALALAQHSDKLEYEKDEISFLLNQVYYQPQKTD